MAAEALANLARIGQLKSEARNLAEVNPVRLVCSSPSFDSWRQYMVIVLAGHFGIG